MWHNRHGGMQKVVDPSEFAEKRHRQNVYSRTNTPLESEAERLGVAGELAFAELVGVDHKVATSAPTRGYQFNLGPKTKIKVTTSRTPGSLFVKEGKVNADVYVLAGVNGEPDKDNVYFVGWCPASTVRAAEVVTPTRKGGYVQPAHKVPKADLTNMRGLMHGLDLNPEHLLRFPLSINGEVEVEPHAVHRQVRNATSKARPLPMKAPKKP